MLSASSSQKNNPTNNLNHPSSAVYPILPRGDDYVTHNGHPQTRVSVSFFSSALLSLKEIYPRGFSNFTFNFRNNAASQPSSTLSTVSNFSPENKAFAPANKHNACVDGERVFLPAAIFT